MSDYKKMVQDEAKSFYDEVQPVFQKDSEEHGGKSDIPNLSKWVDKTRKLFNRLDEVKKGWSRLEAEMVKQNSRNAVPYGDPKESAYFAYYKDIMHEVKKLNKTQMKN